MACVFDVGMPLVGRAVTLIAQVVAGTVLRALTARRLLKRP